MELPQAKFHLSARSSKSPARKIESEDEKTEAATMRLKKSELFLLGMLVVVSAGCNKANTQKMQQDAKATGEAAQKKAATSDAVDATKQKYDEAAAKTKQATSDAVDQTKKAAKKAADKAKQAAK